MTCKNKAWSSFSAQILCARYPIVCAILILFSNSPARATFSIVAVDTANQIVGSAGASCIAGAQIIEGVVESVGAVNTQAYWNTVNQSNADSLLRAGVAPLSIVAWLAAHDAQNDGLSAGDRQYGVVTLAGAGASAAYTGSFTLYWAGHRTGPTYSAQGNILLDSTIVEMMVSAFLGTAGPLENKLMAALQAAKVPGADTRCFPQNKSSISAFIRVVRPGDGAEPYLNLIVSNTTGSTDPIDVLQTQFDAWRALQVADPVLSTLAIAPAGLPVGVVDTAWITVTARNHLNVPPAFGSVVTLSHTGLGTLLPVTALGDGVYKAGVIPGPTVSADTLACDIDGGGQVVRVVPSQVLHYFLCGDVNTDGVQTSSDVILLVNHIFKGGPPPLPVASSGDVNRSGSLTSADIITLVNYVFKSGAPPCG